jgi:hypothetical protein
LCTVMYAVTACVIVYGYVYCYCLCYCVRLCMLLLLVLLPPALISEFSCKNIYYIRECFIISSNNIV